MEREGKAEPIHADEYWDILGTSLGNFYAGSMFVQMSLDLILGPSFNSSTKGFASKTSFKPAEVTTAKKLTSWQQFLKANAGKYSGKGWEKRAAAYYYTSSFFNGKTKVMKKVIYFMFLLLSSCSSTKKEEICTAPGVVDKVVWGYSRRGIEKLAYFTFIYDDQPYTFRDDFHAMMKINVGDSVLVQFNCNNPKKKAKYVKLIKRNGSEPKKETKYVRIDGGVERYDYYGVDKKPLFNGVRDYTENRSAVKSYLQKTLKEMNVQEHGNIGISIVIDKEGKVIESKVLHSNNQKLNDIVLTILKDMPLWTPAEHKGEKVNVDFLIVLDW